MAQRGFIFAVHPTHGLLLLRAYKKKKGVHHQLPGGRVDAEELAFEDAHRRAAARELRRNWHRRPADEAQVATDREGGGAAKGARVLFLSPGCRRRGPRSRSRKRLVPVRARPERRAHGLHLRTGPREGQLIRLHSGGENAVALRALRGGARGTLGGRGPARERPSNE